MEFPITLIIPEFNPREFTLLGIQQEIVSEMIGTVESVLMEANVEMDPEGSTGAGLKFDGNSWQSWEESNHVFTPVNVQVEHILLQATPTANRRQLLQNKDGAIALLDDVYSNRDTVILPEGLVSVSWDDGNDFLCVLRGNRKSAFYMFHSKPGMEIDMLIVNNGTNQLVHAWDPLIHWPAGTVPVVPAANAGTSAMTKINLCNVNGTIYGEYTNYTDAAPWSYDAAQPLFLS